jgi:hypothetical protein
MEFVRTNWAILIVLGSALIGWGALAYQVQALAEEDGRQRAKTATHIIRDDNRFDAIQTDLRLQAQTNGRIDERTKSIRETQRVILQEIRSLRK